MKKLMTLMLGLSLVIGAVSVSFAQGKKDETTAAKKGKAKKAADTAKDTAKK